MIVVGGDVALLVFLLVVGVVVLVPVLVLRGARRAVLTTGGWPVAAGGSGWHTPQQPVLPPVSPADVVSLRDRLGHDVRTLDAGADPVGRQALADAAERHATCSALLERATTDAQLRTAWLAAAEGLAASRVVRTRLGLDPGPAVPLPPAGPPLQAPTRLEVGGRTHVGGPDYGPGRPHWFPGGTYGDRWVPGGWYDAPFWPAALVLGGLGGWALGGLAAGAAYGAVYGDDPETGGWDGGGAGWDGSAGDGFGGSGGGGGWDDGGWDGGGGGDWGGDGGGGGDW